MIDDLWHFQNVYFSNNIFDINSRNQMRKVQKGRQRGNRPVRILLP